MKISHKLIFSYLLIALFIGTGCYLGVDSLHKIRRAFNEVNQEFLPVIQTLENIKFGGLRIIASTSEIVLIQSERDKNNISPPGNALTEEKILITLEKSNYERSLQAFTALAEKFAPEYDEFLQKIKMAGQAIQTTSNQIIQLKHQGISGEKILTTQEKFRQEEQAFLNAVNAAIQHEIEEQQEGHANVISAIDTAITIIFIAAGASLVIVIFFIVLTTSSLAISINKLKEAAIEIGKGKLDTSLDINSRDELGLLSNTFNQMVQDLNKAYREIESSKNYLQNIIRSMTDMLIVINPDSTIRTANPITLNILGYEEQELIGEPVGTIIEEKEVFLQDAGIRKLMEQGTVQNLEKNFISKNGDRIPVLFSGSMIQNPENKVTGFVCVALDITSRKKAEEALKASEQRYRELVERSPTAIFIHSEGKIHLINPAGVRLLGATSAEEIVGKSVTDFIHPDYLEIVEKRIKKIIEEHETAPLIEEKFIRLDGTEIDVEVTGIPLYYQSKPASQVVVQDITVRKQTEQERLRLTTAIEQAAESIVITDQTGKIQYANPAFEDITGYSREEVMGKNQRFLKSGKHDTAFYQEMWNTIKAGQVWKGHITNKRKDGMLYEEELTISPVRNEAGTIINYVGVKKDITRELRLEKQLRQSQKMEALGTLAGGIAHDFNNMLGVILGNVEMLSEDYAHDQELMQSLDPISIAGKRAANLVEQILTFSRMEITNLITVDISDTVREAIQMVRSTIPANIEIRHNIPAACPSIMANPTQIHQIILNLCTNASHAMEENGGILEITLQETLCNTLLFEEDCAQSNPKDKGTCLELIVSDTGAGIPVDEQEKIFDPFFTTKEVGKGTGLGLSVVHGIVRHHKGNMTVTSEPGQGTAFSIIFSIVKEPEIQAPSIAVNVQKKSNAHILIVDDEPGLTGMYEKFLQKQGYTVTIQNNGSDAWKGFQKNPSKYDLVLTDQSMPNLAGKQLSQKILEVRPDIPIILVTGFSHVISEKIAKEIGVRCYLMKPVELKVLHQTIEECLQETG